MATHQSVYQHARPDWHTLAGSQQSATEVDKKKGRVMLRDDQVRSQHSSSPRRLRPQKFAPSTLSNKITRERPLSTAVRSPTYTQEKKVPVS